jgi:hypothetical protein
MARLIPAATSAAPRYFLGRSRYVHRVFRSLSIALYLFYLCPARSSASTAQPTSEKSSIVVATPRNWSNLGPVEGYIASNYRVTLKIDAVISGSVDSKEVSAILMVGNIGHLKKKEPIVVFVDAGKIRNKRPLSWRRLSKFVCVTEEESKETGPVSEQFRRKADFERGSCILYGY